MTVQTDRPDAIQSNGQVNNDGLTIIELVDRKSLEAVEALQIQVWGMAPDVMVPGTLMYTIAAHGGIVLGAYVDGRLAGFVLGLLGQRDGDLYHASHMLGIHPDFQGMGIGAALKHRQRQQALAQGLRMMTWTFDPLESRNAYFNLHKLGGVSRAYRENLYGSMDDQLNHGLPSDRLIVEWVLDAPYPHWRKPEIRRRLALLANRDGVPEVHLAAADDDVVLSVAVPRDIQVLKKENTGAALLWRLALRETLTSGFSRGFVAYDFVDGAYLLARPTEECVS